MIRKQLTIQLMYLIPLFLLILATNVNADLECNSCSNCFSDNDLCYSLCLHGEISSNNTLRCDRVIEYRLKDICFKEGPCFRNNRTEMCVNVNNEGFFWYNSQIQPRCPFDCANATYADICSLVLPSDLAHCHSSLNPKWRFDNEIKNLGLCLGKIPVYNLVDDGNLVQNGELNFPAIGKRFLAEFPDIYDFITIFTVGYESINTPDQYMQIKNNPSKGLGYIDQYNLDPEIFGANKNGRLMGFAHIGLYLESDQIQIYPEDLVFRSILEEIGHNWGVYIGNEYGKGGLEIREQGPHWWRGLQTYKHFDAVREAGPWMDNGDGTFSLPKNHCTIGNRLYSYSPFMLYLMGLADPSEIKSEFVLIKSNELANDRCIENVRGNYSLIKIQDIINAAGGPRTIPTSKSQKDFNIALIIVNPKGSKISDQALNNTKWIANNLPTKWALSTSCRSTLNGFKITAKECVNTIFPKYNISFGH